MRDWICLILEIVIFIGVGIIIFFYPSDAIFKALTAGFIIVVIEQIREV